MKFHDPELDANLFLTAIPALLLYNGVYGLLHNSMTILLMGGIYTQHHPPFAQGLALKLLSLTFIVIGIVILKELKDKKWISIQKKTSSWPALILSTAIFLIIIGFLTSNQNPW